MNSTKKRHILISMFPLFFTHMTQGLLTALPYVLGVYMIRDFGINSSQPPTEEQTGTLTGLLGASFCAAQLLTSYPIGVLSDRIGRKKIILVGNLVCCLGVLFFGLSTSYFHAVASRVFMGLFNAIIGAVKAIIGESLNQEEQAQAMGYISLVWGIGSLIGPSMGILAYPCRRDHHGIFTWTLHSTSNVTIMNNVDGDDHTYICRPDSIWNTRPFFLPCVVAAVMSSIAFFLTLFYMAESLPRLRKKDINNLHSDVEYSQIIDNSTGEVEMVGVDAARWNHPESRASTTLNTPHHPTNRTKEELEDDDGYDADEKDAMLPPLHQHQHHHNNNNNNTKNKEATPNSNFPTPVIYSLAGYTLIAFCHIMIDELVPIFASAPIEAGGLGYSTSMLAAPMACSGFVLMLWALFGYPWLNKRVGVVRAAQHGLIQTIPMALLIPASSFPFLPMKLTFYAALAFKSIAGTNAFTSAIILVNITAPKSALGAVNGVGQTLASAVRALGPALGGYMWSLSIRLFKGLGFSSPFGHQFLPFGVASCVALITLISVYPYIQVPPESQDDDTTTGRVSDDGTQACDHAWQHDNDIPDMEHNTNDQHENTSLSREEKNRKVTRKDSGLDAVVVEGLVVVHNDVDIPPVNTMKRHIHSPRK